MNEYFKLEDRLVKKNAFYIPFFQDCELRTDKIVENLDTYITRYITRVLFISATFQDVHLPQSCESSLSIE